jgi:glycine cleavage system H protein
MKKINDLNFPEDIHYTASHEWARPAGDRVKIGITDYAQDQLGDVVYVEMSQAGESFAKGDEFGTVESVKAVSELYMPIGGEILAVNPSLEDAPEMVNNTPYSDGWMIEVKPDDPAELESLMTKKAYVESLEE